jgi:hypothetical protein
VTIRDAAENAVHDEGSSLDGGDVTLLAQQELVEPAPVRRLIVPRGHGAWWGVDPSTRRVAVGGVSRAADGSLDRWVRSVPFMAVDGPGRLSMIYNETYDLVQGIALRAWEAHDVLPGLVLVEQPGGEHRNYELFYAVGAIVAAIDGALVAETGKSVKFEMVVPAWWKARACGRGNIYKTKRVPGRKSPVPVAPDEYGVLQWARQNGYAGASWDEADAWGIAEAARREVALVER